MITTYKCEYCNVKTDCLSWMEEHERLCFHNPKNSKCYSCVRHFWIQEYRENLCTKYGINHDLTYGQKCSFYIKDNKEE